MNPTYQYLLNVIQNQLTQLASGKIKIPDDRSDWINPEASTGNTVWKVIDLEVLDYDQNSVVKSYRIHSDSVISVLNQTLMHLHANPNDMLIMSPGIKDGESLGLLSNLNNSRSRSAIPGFYLYLNS